MTSPEDSQAIGRHTENPLKVIDRITKQVESNKIKPEQLITDADFLLQMVGEGGREKVQPFLREAVRRAPEGVMQVALIDRLTGLYNKDKTTHSEGDAIRRYIQMGEDLGVTGKPEGQRFLEALQDKYGEKSAVAEEFIPESGTEPRETVDSANSELIKVWQDSSREPVMLSKIRLGEKLGERLWGSNFTGFVLPTDEAEMVCEDRAGFVELSDGTKVFLGADGVGGSYMGSLAAQVVIDIAQNGLSTDGLDHLKIMFADPVGFVQALGERLKDSQAMVLKHYQEHYANQSQIIKDVFDAQAQRGSQTTFFMVAVSPGGEVRYISLGDGVIEKMAADGSIEDFLPTEKSRAPEGVFSTVEGFKGQFRKGAIYLNAGDVLLFGTDGVKHNLEGLQKSFADKSHWPFYIDQVDDDLTVFAYEQQEGKGVTPESQDKIPLEEIHSWEELRQRGFDWSVAKIGQGISGGVFRTDWRTKDGKIIPVVVKHFKGRDRTVPSGDYLPEKEALIRLRGIPGVVQIFAYGEAGEIGIDAPIIVEEWVEAENIQENSELFPISTESSLPINQELEQKARWLLSYMETVAEMHKRGVVFNDFKFDHILWDSKSEMVKMIDFGNAIIIDSPRGREGKKPVADIIPALDFLFANTSEGVGVGLVLTEMGTTRYRDLTMNWKTFTEAFEAECQKQKAVPEFINLIKRYKNVSDTREDGEGPYNTQALIRELKDYFMAIGLDIHNKI